MKDFNVVVDAVRQLNQVWANCTKDEEKQDSSSEVYNAMCETDEAIINLVEKISLCAKAQLVSTMYGNSELATTHSAITTRA